tara:strand:- start:209 stop:538 length:330 start_codon:yes stop_codon:yes gene_type:complete
MRSWEKKDITDILIAHHKELNEASCKLSEYDCVNDNLPRGRDELDDDCIVIENFLEESFDILWDGLKFIFPKERDIPREMCQDLLDLTKKKDNRYAPATKQAVEQTNDE